MLTSLFTGVSGMNANMTALSVIGNNIANMNTVGFKASRASFSDILSQTLNGVSGSAQVGLGVTLSSITPLFTQGAFETTGNGLDMAVDGDGFFVLRDSTGANYYSRAGQFNVNKDGYITNPEGYVLRGYQADSMGALTSTVGDLQLSSAAIPPNSTAQVDFTANLQSDAEIKGFVFTNAADDIVFNAGGPDITLQLIADGGLRANTPYTGAQVAAALETALEATNGSTDTYTVTYDGATGKFNITNDNGNVNPLNVKWATDPGTTAEAVLGFTADDAVAVGSSVISDAAAGAFDVAFPSATANFSTAVTVYDSLGNSHQINVYFRKDTAAASGNAWEWFAVVDAADSSSSTAQTQAQGTLTFNTNGALDSTTSTTYPTGGFDFSGGATQDQIIGFGFGTSIVSGGTGIDGVTQYGQGFAVYNQQQDGYASGSLQGVSADTDGVLTGIFSNGRTRTLGEVVLADFPNSTALALMGKNLYAESTGSGQPLVGAPNSSGRGGIHSNALELSTVDIAEEFVKMISAQRGFQANSKVITTTDEILNELVNIKR
ncbi:MAG: flagellar hook protein FlgE [Deltaproteobacteria bacterium]|nr:flagellar hook protein FlgE [Deltaproteobacteria bacterium]